MQSISFCCPSFQEDSVKELKLQKYILLYRQMASFIKALNILFARLCSQKIMFNRMSPVILIFNNPLQKLRKQVLRLGFGKLEMDFKTTFYLCDIIKLNV